MKRTALGLFFILILLALLTLYALSFWGQDRNLRAQAHTGEVVQLSALPGDLRLVYFGYMSCPSVCLDAAISIGSALRILAAENPAARAQLTNVFVTVDPDDDIIAGDYNELGEYMYGRYGNQGVALRPKDQAEAEAMAGAYGITFAYRPNAYSPSGYVVDHASKIFLTDRFGDILVTYGDRTPGFVIADDVIAALGL